MRTLLASLLFLAVPAVASAQGVSARFGNLVATFQEDFSPRIEVSDALGVVDRVVLELRAEGQQEWQRTEARRTRRGDWWQGTFTSTSVWTSRKEPAYLQLRAQMLGKRGGVILTLGDLEPLLVEVLTRPEVEARERKFRLYSPTAAAEEDVFSLTGYVGADGRLGSGARARLFIGAGGSLTELLELIVFITVGPSFSEPTAYVDSGPLVLGFETAFRIFTRSPLRHDWTLFVEPLLQLDLRFPGIDPGVGLRGGLTYQLSGDLAVDVGLGGSVLLIDTSEVGFTGGLRVALRFGGPKRITEQR